MRHVIYIPNWHPASVNKLMGHWASASKIKNADMQMMAMYALKAKVPPADGKRRLEITLKINTAGRTPDPDNFYKSVCDGLKRCGYIKDDSGTWLEITPTKFERGKDMATILILEDME